MSIQDKLPPPVPSLDYNSFGQAISMRVHLSYMDQRDKITLFLALARKLHAFDNLPVETANVISRNINKQWGG